MSDTYIEVRIKACTGAHVVLHCANEDYQKSRQEAAQIASIISMLTRTGRPICQFRAAAPADWFAGFGDDAHIAEIKVSRVRVVDSYLDRYNSEREMREPITLRNTLQRLSWECEHAQVRV